MVVECPKCTGLHWKPLATVRRQMILDLLAAQTCVDLDEYGSSRSLRCSEATYSKNVTAHQVPHQEVLSIQRDDRYLVNAVIIMLSM
jgi:hypothetical protein